MTSPQREKTLENRPIRFGKSAFVTNSFLVSIEAGENPIYHHKDYVCMSRKMFEALTHQRQELIALVEGMKKPNDPQPSQIKGIPFKVVSSDIQSYNQALEDIKTKLTEAE